MKNQYFAGKSQLPAKIHTDQSPFQESGFRQSAQPKPLEKPTFAMDCLHQNFQYQESQTASNTPFKQFKGAQHQPLSTSSTLNESDGLSSAPTSAFKPFQGFKQSTNNHYFENQFMLNQSAQDHSIANQEISDFKGFEAPKANQSDLSMVQQLNGQMQKLSINEASLEKTSQPMVSSSSQASSSNQQMKSQESQQSQVEQKVYTMPSARNIFMKVQSQTAQNQSQTGQNQSEQFQQNKQINHQQSPVKLNQLQDKQERRKFALRKEFKDQLLKDSRQEKCEETCWLNQLQHEQNHGINEQNSTDLNNANQLKNEHQLDDLLRHYDEKRYPAVNQNRAKILIAKTSQSQSDQQMKSQESDESPQKCDNINLNQQQLLHQDLKAKNWRKRVELPSVDSFLQIDTSQKSQEPQIADFPLKNIMKNVHHKFKFKNQPIRYRTLALYKNKLLSQRQNGFDNNYLNHFKSEETEKFKVFKDNELGLDKILNMKDKHGNLINISTQNDNDVETDEDILALSIQHCYAELNDFRKAVMSKEYPKIQLKTSKMVQGLWFNEERGHIQW